MLVETSVFLKVVEHLVSVNAIVSQLTSSHCSSTKCAFFHFTLYPTPGPFWEARGSGSQVMVRTPTLPPPPPRFAGGWEGGAASVVMFAEKKSDNYDEGRYHYRSHTLSFTSIPLPHSLSLSFFSVSPFVFQYITLSFPMSHTL